MIARGQMVRRAAIAYVLASLLTPPTSAESWGPREDVGVAAVDTRTGKVIWEAWRLDEVPTGTSKEEKAAVEYLLRIEDRREKPENPLPLVPMLPGVSVKDLAIKNPWPEEMYYGMFGGRGTTASEGKGLIYYRDGVGVITLDRQTKKEAWRLLTTRYPYRSLVLEAGENRAFIQIGSHVPATLGTALGADHTLRMRALEPHTVKQRVAAAVLLHQYGDGYLRQELRKTVEKLRTEKIDPDAEPAAKAIEKLLAAWPPKRDRQRLLEGCVAALLKSDEGNPFREFAWPEAQRVLVWCLLQELIYGTPQDGYSRQGYNYAYHHGWVEQTVSLTDATRAKLADHCRKVVAEGPDSEKPFAASILLSTAIGWAKLTDAERKKLFLSSEPSGWRWAALTLVKNGRREQLIEWAKERPVGDLLDVIWVLRNKQPKEPKHLAGAELHLWLNCARHDAGGVAYVLRMSDGPTPLVFREPIRSYLEREIKQPTVKNGGIQSASNLYAAIDVLDAWKKTDDTPLLLEYLKHPLRDKVNPLIDGREVIVWVYRIRSHVRSLLEKRGVKVPAGIVYMEKVEPEKE